MVTLTDWQLLSGPGITVNTTNMPLYVKVDDTSNVVLSGVDFSLHNGAVLFFVNSPNPTVTGNNFGWTNLTTISASIMFADSASPNFTVSHNTIDGAGSGSGSSIISVAGGGTTTLSYNWLKNFPQHVLEISIQDDAPYSVIYKYNLIEQGAMAPGAHLNYLQFGANLNSSLAVDVECNTSYQTRQASSGERYQFYSNGTGLIKNVTYAYDVMIAAAPGAGLPVPVSLLSMSTMVHGGSSQNAGIVHDNYIDKTAAYFWFYANSFTGWNFSNNYNMRPGLPYPRNSLLISRLTKASRADSVSMFVREPVESFEPLEESGKNRHKNTLTHHSLSHRNHKELQTWAPAQWKTVSPVCWGQKKMLPMPKHNTECYHAAQHIKRVKATWGYALCHAKPSVSIVRRF
ncbi:MAG: hypothetical protein M3178_08045 [Pseudomonadota bacterium]|nr:hypothetical protein [Pseudomonadota bacterium]